MELLIITLAFAVAAVIGQLGDVLGGRPDNTANA